MTKTDLTNKERHLLSFFLGKDLHVYYWQNDILKATNSKVSYGRKLMFNLERQNLVERIKVTIDNSHFLKVRLLLDDYHLRLLLESGNVSNVISEPSIVHKNDINKVSDELLTDISFKLDKIINLLTERIEENF